MCSIGDFTQRSLRDLLDIGREIGRRAILIPTTDDGAVFVADHANALKQWFMFPDQSTNLVHSLCSKKEMYNLARKFRVPTPEAAFPRSREDVLAFLKNAAFPIMIKPIRSWGSRRPQSRAIVHEERELIERYDAMEDPERPNLMLQEYIPGRDEDVWMFNGYFNQDSECLVGFTGRKIRQWPVHQGVTTLGICQRNEIVEKMTKEFMKAIRYRGVLDIGYRYDVRDNRYKVLDINPRIGGTFRLFVAENGMDVARALYLDMTGQPIDPAVAPDGRKWLVENRDLASSFLCYLDGNLSLKQWIVSYHGVRETAYFAFDDPLPLVLRLGHNIRQLLGKTRIPRSSSRLI